MTSPTGRVASLVGSDWKHLYRFLHPAHQEQGGQRVRVRWADVAAERGVQLNFASADWYAVSGYRLHHPSGGGAVDEPVAGPASSVLLPVLQTLAAQHDIAELMLAEWTGYDKRQSGRLLPGATYEGLRRFGYLEYSVWRTTITKAAEFIGADRFFGSSPDGSVFANYIWDASEDWLVAADGDLASTYVASQCSIREWPPELEWFEVHGDAPLS